MQKIADLGVVVVAGGSSRRYGDENKLFALLGGLPVFIHSLKSFAPLLKKEALVLVVPENGRTFQFLPQGNDLFILRHGCISSSTAE